MKNLLKLTTLLALMLLLLALLPTFIHAQTSRISWVNRERVFRVFDTNTEEAVAAIEKTVADAFETEEEQAAFIAALEGNLFPPKTGQARVQALDEIQERVERELGADTPILTSIRAEKESAESAVREEAVLIEAEVLNGKETEPLGETVRIGE